MEAVSIANFVGAPAAPATSVVPATTGGSDGSGSVPSFTQVVREILIRTNAGNGSQPALTLQPKSLPATKGGASPSSDSGQAASNPNGVVTLDPVMLSLISSLNLQALAQAPATPVAGGPKSSAPAEPAPEVQSAVPISTAASADQRTNALQVSVVRAAAASLTAQTTQVQPFPNTSLAGPVFPQRAAAPSDAVLATASKLVGDSPAANPPQISTNRFSQNPSMPAPATLTAKTQVQESAAVPATMTAKMQVQESAAVPAAMTAKMQVQESAAVPATMTAKTQVQESAAVPATGTPISSVLPQIAQLHPTALADATRTVSPAVLVAHSAVAHTAVEAALAAAALPNDRAPVSLPTAGPKTSQPTPPEPLAAGPAPTTSNSGHSSSQENSPNHGGQNTADSAASANPVQTHETPSFSQAISATAGAKADAAAPVTNASPVVVPSSGVVNDRPAPSAQNSSQPAPSPLPQPPAHTFESAASRFVNDAQILQNAGHSEMRIALQTDKLGAVELRAHMAGDEVGAAITVEKRDAHAALAAELPALQQALSEKQLRVDQVALLHGSLHSTAGDAGGQSQTQQGERGAPRPQSPQPSSFAVSNALASSQGILETRGIFDSQGRLSVRA